MPDPARIYLALPTYDGFAHVGAIQAVQSCLLPGDDASVQIAFKCNSLLAFVFNQCWCEARNGRRRVADAAVADAAVADAASIGAADAGSVPHGSPGFTHFAMLHADIWPDQLGWLSILLRELEAHDADVVSAIVAIKDNRGVTSTAWHPFDTPFDNALIEQIKIADLPTLPRTFDACSAGKPGHYLLGNTGCFIADLRKPWVDDVDFNVESWTVAVADAASIGSPDAGSVRHVPKVLPEDWRFSRDVADRGGRVMATQAVSVAHVGTTFYRTT